MIKINLLPIRQQRKDEAARREATLIVAIAGVVILACLAVWALGQARLATMLAENSALQTEINQLEEQVREVDAMEKAKTELERKLAVIADLRDKKAGPVHMLDELAIAAPERVVLTSLKQKGEGIELQGISVSNEVISQFLRALDSSEYFDAVYLKDIEALPKQKQGSGTVILKKFELTSRMVTPPRTPSPEATPAETPAAKPEDGAAAPAPEAAPAAAGGGA